MHLEALTKEGKEIFLKLNQFSDFYLAGGTALALQLGHRISVDFDLFSGKDIQKELLAQVKGVFAGDSISPLINNPEELSALVRGVKITFLKYPFPVLGELIELDGLKAFSVLELSATKAYSIGRRGSFRDYVDLYFVLAGNYAPLEQIIDLAEQKYVSEFNSRLFLEQLIYLEDVEEATLLFLKKPITKKQIEEFFIEQAKKIKL